MGAYKDETKNGTWFCKFAYTNWKGEKLTKKKRGFATKKDALNWEREFLIAHSNSVEMTFCTDPQKLDQNLTIGGRFFNGKIYL